MHFDPARRARHVLPMVLGPPTLDEAHANGAHLRQLVHGLEAVVDALREQLGELGIVEDAQGAPGRDLADGRWMETVVVVTVAGLHKDGGIGKAFRIHLAVDVVQVDALADVASRVLDGRVAVHVAQLAQAETVAIIAGVREAVHDDRGRVAVENLQVVK